MTDHERAWFRALDSRLAVLSCRATVLAHPSVEHPTPEETERAMRIALLHGIRELVDWVGIETIRTP
jgi:hypothetical protein